MDGEVDVDDEFETDEDEDEDDGVGEGEALAEELVEEDVVVVVVVARDEIGKTLFLVSMGVVLADVVVVVVVVRLEVKLLVGIRLLLLREGVVLVSLVPFPLLLVRELVEEEASDEAAN